MGCYVPLCRSAETGFLPASLSCGGVHAASAPCKRLRHALGTLYDLEAARILSDHCSLRAQSSTYAQKYQE